jgi:hypothetical protein
MSIIPKEKTFRFTKSMGHNGVPITEQVKESQLSPHQIQVIYGELIRKFNDAPRKVQTMFISKMASELRAKSEKRMMKDLTKRIKEHGEKSKPKEPHNDSTK